MSHSPKWNSHLSAHQFGPFVIRPHVMDEMRGWCEDCSWGEHAEDPDFLHKMPDESIIRGVQRHYEGGVREFLRGQ